MRVEEVEEYPPFKKKDVGRICQCLINICLFHLIRLQKRPCGCKETRLPILADLSVRIRLTSSTASYQDGNVSPGYCETTLGVAGCLAEITPLPQIRGDGSDINILVAERSSKGHAPTMLSDQGLRAVVLPVWFHGDMAVRGHPRLKAASSFAVRTFPPMRQGT